MSHILYENSMKQSKEAIWNSFGNELWNIAYTFRSDIVKPTIYLEEFSYLFFLRLFDEQEKYRRNVVKELDEQYVSIMPQEHRSFNRACDFRNHATKMVFKYIDFLDKIFLDIAKLPDTEDFKKNEYRIISKIFYNKLSKIQYDTAIQVMDKLRFLKIPTDELNSLDTLG